VPPALVVVGGSLGGFQAVKQLLEGLSADFPLPLVLALHRSSGSGAALPSLLQQHSALTVLEAEDKEPLRSGHVYLAPAGYHLLVEPGSLALSTEAPVLYARPSIDVLFESAAEAYRSGVIGIVLTSSSQDGAAGLACIKRHGGVAVVQDPATAESPVLPRAALAATTVDRVLALDSIAPFLVERCRRQVRA
jgi:two-component system chemotaxis response regulator CheB